MTDKQIPAFPTNERRFSDGILSQEASDGMTLRDYFAAKAMQALITSRHTDYENGWYAEDALASSSYNMAEAMLAERNK